MLYAAGAIASVGNSIVPVGFSNPELETIELVDVRSLETIPWENRN